MWWGIVLHVYIKQILKLLFDTAKSLYIFSLKINPLIHRTMWVDSVCRFMRIPFSTDTQGSAENRSCVMEFLINVFTRFKHHEKLVSVESLCKEESDRLVSLHSFCTEYIDRTSELSYWLNSCCHGNRGGICLDCLPEDSSAICSSTLLPQVLYPIGSVFCY